MGTGTPSVNDFARSVRSRTLKRAMSADFASRATMESSWRAKNVSLGTAYPALNSLRIKSKTLASKSTIAGGATSHSHSRSRTIESINTFYNFTPPFSNRSAGFWGFGVLGFWGSTGHD